MNKSAKDRKTHSGKIYDKERTKKKLVSAVGKILKTEGHTSLKIGRIAEVAKVNKKLIYLYFGSLDKLIENYLTENDYWVEAEESVKKKSLTNIDRDTAFNLLKNQFDFFETSAEMQNIVRWELSEYNETLRKAVDQREEFGKDIFKITDKQFRNSGVDFRALNALFVGAIYYLVLHSRANGGTTCEIDITTSKGKKAILNTISQVLGWAYEKAEKNNA